MAKIKLSALVSDIKGKMEGTVFARNGGGLYMRNNPIGVQKMTAKWGANKSRFASVVSSWRELTAKQQAYWNEMAVNYTGHSIFGDDRKRSGYELFVKINQTLITSGLPAVLEPQMPVEFPDLGEPFGFMPNNEHIVNESFFIPTGIGGDPEAVSFNNSLIEVPYAGNKKFLISLRFSIGQKARQRLEAAETICLISPETGNPDTLEITLKKNRSAYRISTELSHDGKKMEFSLNFNELELLEQNVLTLNFAVDEPENAYIMFNKKGYPSIAYQSDFTGNEGGSFLCIPFPTVYGDLAPIGIQFLNIGNGDYEPRHATLLHWGYQLDEIDFVFLFTEKESEMYQFGGTVNIGANFKLPIVPDKDEYFYTGYHDIFPYFAVKFLPFDDSQFRMVIKSTSLRSGGLTGATSNFNIVGRYQTNGNNKIEIGQDLEERLQYIAKGGVIALQYQLMNIFTGQLSAPQTMNYLGLPEEIGIAPQAGCSEHSHCMPDETCSNGKCYPNNWDCRDYAYLQMSPKTKRKPKFKPGSELATLVHK